MWSLSFGLDFNNVVFKLFLENEAYPKHGASLHVVISSHWRLQRVKKPCLGYSSFPKNSSKTTFLKSSPKKERPSNLPC